MSSQHSVLLVSFHNQKALGVRYLEKSLKAHGYQVTLVFFKGFNSVKPENASTVEIEALKEIIGRVKPQIIGLSVMSSLYLETVYAVNAMIKKDFSLPVVWGGVYATLFPDRCLENADFAIRGEGENTIVELADALIAGTGYEAIPNLAYKKAGSTVVNEVRPLCQNLDEYGYPELGGDNKYFINNDSVSAGDPMLHSISFELTASRGCPFVCSYCSSVNLSRVYKGKGAYVRFRSVESVLDELNEAKRKMKNLKFVHFWDEIFSDDEHWIDEFTRRYKEEINLPFEIWCHPLKINKKLIARLVEIGLFKAVMGIQSGSPRIRKEIFHRVEKQEDIINASRVLSECKVPQVIYDFMLRHPFETEEDIKQTYELCTQMVRPFELQLHGLNFLPGTDIVDMAVKQGLLTPEQLEEIMYSPIQKQYDAYWGNESRNSRSNFWYMLIYISQFGIMKPFARMFSKDPGSSPYNSGAKLLYKLSKPLNKARYAFKKFQLLIH